MRILRNIFLFFLPAVAVALASCTDDEDFSTSQRDVLTFSSDTISFDTLFSRTPSSTRTFWVYNKSSAGIRCSSIRLAKGNQTGYRVNVNGVFLGEKQGYQLNNEEIRKGDSLRVFIELTSAENGSATPQEVSDRIDFLLESGVSQSVQLKAYSWDALKLKAPVFSRDTILTSDKPIVINGMAKVEEGVTLTLPAGTTLYMDYDSGIEVCGTLLCLGEAGKEVTLRSSRLDRMFDNLLYDEVSGQWRGIVFREKSFGNRIEHTDIHAACDAIVCDSSDTEREKLHVSSSTIHNNKGYGIVAENCRITIDNSQVSNTLRNCIGLLGGMTTINHTTIAQFYPLSADRGSALLFSDATDTAQYPNSSLLVRNSIITGYANEEYLEIFSDSTTAEARIEYSLLRGKEREDSLRFPNVIYENAEDTASAGYRNFRNDLEVYVFRLKKTSKAVDAADPTTSLPLDRNALPRDEKPDMGCYEYIAEEEEETEKN